MNVLSSTRLFLYRKITHYQAWKYRLFYGMDIGQNVIINRRVSLDRAINPKGIHIGSNCQILAKVCILSHDACRGLKADTYIGSNTVIGIRSIILPGVHVGNHCVIGAGSVVTKDIPDHCIAAGNPASVIRKGISVENGRIVYTKNIII